MNRMTKPRTMIDLFAGCGGMTAGFALEGFKSALAVEFNDSAAATYAMNFGEQHTFHGDIATLPADRIPHVDVGIGGPPCQGFSNLGNKDVNDPRNKLWKEYLRVVAKASPKVFVLENVQRFLKSSEFQLLLDEADHGVIKDYELSYGVLLAADFGVAQRARGRSSSGHALARSNCQTRHIRSTENPAPSPGRRYAVGSQAYRPGQRQQNCRIAASQCWAWKYRDRSSRWTFHSAGDHPRGRSTAPTTCHQTEADSP